MKFGVPWGAKGIRPEARETAKEAARKSGMSLEDWLNSVILRQAAQQFRPVPTHGGDNLHSEDLATVNQRLDDLARRIEQMARSGPAAYAPRRDRNNLDQFAGTPRTAAASPLAPPTPQANLQLPSGLDRAVAEVSARRRALNSEPVVARAQPQAPIPTAEPAVDTGPVVAPAIMSAIAAAAPPLRTPLPAQNLSGLENQLRRITDQIETLRKPDIEDAINAFRKELGEVGRALSAAMPRRAIESIEKQIHGLATRLNEGRQAGVDQHALAGIEHGLADVRNALHGLMPAENLVGFNEAVSRLTYKVDQIVAQNDPATLKKLESTVTTLREMVGQIASNETVSRLASEVQSLAAMVDQLAHAASTSDAFVNLDHRVTALVDVLAKREQSGNVALPRLEALTQSLVNKIDQIQSSGADNAVSQRLEALVQSLSGKVEMLQSSRDDNAVSSRLEALVQPLADKIDQIRSSGTDNAVSQRLEALVQSLSSRIEMLQLSRGDNAVSSRLEALVQSLANKIDQIQSSGGDNAVSQRLEALVQLFADKFNQIQTSLGDNAVSQQLESLIQSLAEKIDTLRSSRDDSVAISHLEDRIVNLAAKLDASESRLGQLDVIERGLSDLLVHIEEMKASNPAGDVGVDAAPVIGELNHNMARTQDALESVHGTLSLVVDRLAMIETEFRGEGHAQSPAEDASAPPLDKLAVREAPKLAPMLPGAPLQMPEPPPPAAHVRIAEPPSMPPAAHVQISESPQSATHRRTDTSLPTNPEPSVDQPLEPGSGPPQFSARIAASEAALGGAVPAATTASGEKSNFIAAARRAAQAATQQLPTAPSPRREPALELKEPGQPTHPSKIRKRVKSLVIAASIIAIVVGGFQIAGNVFNRGGGSKNETPKSGQAETGDAEPAKAEISVREATPTAPASRDATPPELSAASPLAAPTSTGTMPLMPPTGINAATQTVPPLLNPPALSASAIPGAKPPAEKDDATGSIPETAANPDANRSGESALPEHEHLPLAIGGPRLRSAAIGGDAAAAYEVAVRLAEGHGAPANLEDAAYWFARAASGGLAPAEFRYASMLEKGQGVKKDKGLALKFYLAAAAKGHGKAMHNLAVLYAQGVDGKADYGAAAKWFGQAAQRGVADSQYNLGVLTARGFGTEKNFAESYKWFALAAAQGDQESAKKRDEIATHLDATALAAAQQAVKTFKVKPQPKTATAVPKPQGGWDNAASAPHSPPKAKVQPQARQPLHAPLSLGSFTIGKQ